MVMSIHVKYFRRKWCLFAGLLVILTVSAPQIIWAQDYLAEISDFPIMDGLEEITDAGLVFDKADGRIVTAMLEGPVSLADGRQFYLASLTALGWRLVLENESGSMVRFEREAEILTLYYQASDGVLALEIDLRPKVETES